MLHLIPEIDSLNLTLSRSLILCHSKTNDDYTEEKHAGQVSDGCGTWGPSCETDVSARDRPHHRDTENRHWRKTQQSTLERNGGNNTDNLVHHTITHRENKRSLRRSFSIKVQLHYYCDHLHKK